MPKVTKYEEYISDVKAGNILTNRYIKLSVDRFEKFRERDDMYFSKEAVDNAINFMQAISLFEGHKAGQPFKLEGWQAFIVANIYGFYWKDNDKRVTRTTFVFVSRKNGKSSFAAALALNQLWNDAENSPSVILAANTTSQSQDLFEKAQMFNRSLDTRRKYSKNYRNQIKTNFNNGNLKVTSSELKSIEGANASTFILDEYHQASDNKVLNSLRLSQGARENPLGIIITTAGVALGSPCHDLWSTSVNILQGNQEDDSFFPMLFGLDEGDKWDDPVNWGKSNPNLDVSITTDAIENQLVDAKNNVRNESEFKTKVLNEWVTSSMFWLSSDNILLNSKKLKLKDFNGLKCDVGIDLASVSDLTAIAIRFVKDGHSYFFHKYYLPSESLNSSVLKEYWKVMHRQKQLILTPGNVTDYDYILDDLMKLSKTNPIDAVYFDQWNATQFQINATHKGLNMVPVRQNFTYLSAPTKEFERLFLSGLITLDDNEITKFCFRNAMLKEVNGNVRITKENNRSKIDGATATIMTMQGGLLGEEEEKVYDLEIV